MTIHVYPINDWIDHDIDSKAADCKCPCEPRMEYIDSDTGLPYSDPLVIHNAIDQRELTENQDEGTKMESTQCYSAPYPRSRWQNLKNRLFPCKLCFAPDAPSHFKDCIHGTAITKLSWTDRLRVLVTGVVVTRWRTVTEHEVGSTVNAAECYIGTSDDLRQ